MLILQSIPKYSLQFFLFHLNMIKILSRKVSITRTTFLHALNVLQGTLGKYAQRMHGLTARTCYHGRNTRVRKVTCERSMTGRGGSLAYTVCKHVKGR
jgi:hypothetical protein